MKIKFSWNSQHPWVFMHIESVVQIYTDVVVDLLRFGI